MIKLPLCPILGISTGSCSKYLQNKQVRLYKITSKYIKRKCINKELQRMKEKI